MTELKGYLASQFGFSDTGRYLLENLIKPKLRDIGITPLDPFEACAKELDFMLLSSLDRYESRRKYWEQFSRKVTPINNALMQESHCLLPLLDGGHALDDGVASEIGYYAGIKKGPIFALRTDVRCGENIAVSINPQVWGYILLSNGKLDDSVDAWVDTLQQWKHKNSQEK